MMIIFLIIVYLFTYMRYKRMRRKKIDAVQSFRDTYDDVCHATDTQSAITGCMDFIDKEEFISEIQAEINESNCTSNKKAIQKKLIF